MNDENNHITPQNIVILFTGQIRTLKKTIENFKKNILDNNPIHNIHIFAVLEYPSNLDPQTQTDYIKSNEHIFYQHLEHHLKNILWIESKDKKLQKFKKDVLDNMDITDYWKDYLGNRSGSISEYYQLNLGIEMISQFVEKMKNNGNENFKFDYFMRTRCDIMIPNPITFDPLGDTKENLKKRYECIKELFPEANDKLLYCYYIESLYYPFPFPSNARFLMDKNEEYKHKYLLEMYLPKNFDPDVFSRPYEISVPYVSVHRQNLFYIMSCIPVLLNPNQRFMLNSKIKKGLNVNNEKEGLYWFNSENQFQSHHYNENRIQINSHTTLEESSLYNYNETNFEISNPLFCFSLFYICRN